MESMSIEQLIEAISNPDENISKTAAALVEKRFAELEAKPKQTEKIEVKEEIFKNEPLSHKRVKELLQKETLNSEEKYELLRSLGVECVDEGELKNLLSSDVVPICYDGFEPSGKLHIAQGIIKAINIKKSVKAGCKCIIWIADWFAVLNNKLSGDIKKIRAIGEYMIEIWKSTGLLTEEIAQGKVEFKWTSDEVNANPNDYWLRVVDVARKFKLPTVVQCSEIMGIKDEKENKGGFGSHVFYVCMQAADIFHLKANICQQGTDQRKVNKLAREYYQIVSDAGVKLPVKPIILSHQLLSGLGKGAKMSKTDQTNAIFMDDSESDVNIKIKGAFCPPNIVQDNPCFDYLENIVFPVTGLFSVTRSPENGGNITYDDFSNVVKDFETGKLHPGDLKPALSIAINNILKPVREHLDKDPKAKQLAKQVKGYKLK